MPRLRNDVTNVDILNAIRADARVDYQRMVPEATKANIRETMNGILNHEWLKNQFLDALFNQIGTTVVRDFVWKNPLAVFKQGMLNFGDTIQEVHADMVAPSIYNAERDYMEGDVFGQADMPLYSAFHTINRQEKFKITVNQDILRRAFLNDSGLAQMVNNLMAIPATSDEWSEFLAITSLLREYEETNGFFRVKIPDMNVFQSDKTLTDQALKALRSYADKMTYPTPAFNAKNVHSFANPDDLVLIATPEFKANVDVTSLSAAFNRDDANAPSQIITVPNEALQLKDASALLTTRQFFVIADTLIANKSIENPAGLYNNYWLHHHEIISCSPFTPAILFGTKENTQIINVTPNKAVIKGIGVFDKDGKHVVTVKQGDYRQCKIDWTTAPAAGMFPGVDWEITGATSDKTVITNDGVLKIGSDEKVGREITITATVLMDDPATPAVDYPSKTITVTVAAK